MLPEESHMPLGFRIISVCYMYLAFPLSVWLLSTAVLGKKLKTVSCLVYCILGLAISWIDMLAGVLTGYLESSSPVEILILDLAMLTAYALTAGIFLAKLYRLPFIQTLTAAMLGNFAAYTSGAAADAVSWTYTPLFDGKYLLVLTTIYLPYTLMLLIVLLFSLLLRRSEFYRYFTALFETKKRTVLTLAVSFVLMCTWGILDFCFPNAEADAGYALSFLLLIAAALFCIQFLAMYVSGQDRLRAQEEVLAQQRAHMALLEELQQEVRAFRHDFANLLSGLTLQAQEGDLDGIRDFMKKTGNYFDEKLGNEIRQLDSLNNIRPYPLRSLISSKLAHMRQEQIQVILEVQHPLHETCAMNTEDLLRALGILLDNAMEAVPEQGGQIRLVLLQQDRELYIAAANNYAAKPELSALSRKGYTTKGKGHGTGLSSYRKITSRCPGCVTRTCLRDNFFVQELHIPSAQIPQPAAARKERL